MRKILKSAFIGTTVMTIASYFYSELRNKNFKEPHLLTILLGRWFPKQSYEISVIEAWIIHYLIGVLFVLVYVQFWKRNFMLPTIANGFLMGAITGVPAAIGWHITLFLHPNPPQVDLPEFYGQLVLVHAIFGALASWIYHYSRKSYT